MEKQIETEEPRSRFAMVVTVVLVLAFAAWFTLAIRANRARSSSNARTSAAATMAQSTQSVQPSTVHSGLILDFSEHRRLNSCRNTGLGDSNTDSIFVVQDVD